MSQDKEKVQDEEHEKTMPLKISLGVSLISLLMLAYFVGQVEMRVRITESRTAQMETAVQQVSAMTVELQNIKDSLEDLKRDLKDIKSDQR